MSIKSAVLTGLNHLLKRNWRTDERLSKFSGEMRSKQYRDYSRAAAIDAKNLPSDTNFQTYLDGKSSLNAFAKVQTPEGDDVMKKLRPGIKKQISAALQATGETKTAETSYQNELKNLKQYIEDSDNAYEISVLTDALQEIKSEAHTAITEQHKVETENLSQLFESDNFLTDLRQDLEIDRDDTQSIQKIKDDMLAALQKSHTDALQAFDKSMNEPIKNLHQAASEEASRIPFLAHLYENNEKMRQVIDVLHRENKQKKDAEIEIEFSATKNHALFKGITLKSVFKKYEEMHKRPVFESITGRPVKPNADGSFLLDFPNRLWFRSLGPNYYRGSKHSSKADLLLLAAAVKAEGFDGITTSINSPKSGKDKDHPHPNAMHLGCEAFEAAIEMGFDPKKIKIKFNPDGLTWDYDKMRAAYPSRMEAAMNKAANSKKLMETAEKGESNQTKTKNFRNDVKQKAANAQPNPEDLERVHIQNPGR